MPSPDDESFMLHKIVAVLQWVALLAIPQLLWKPHWASFLALVGGERAANVFGNPLLTLLMLLLGNLFFYALYKLRWDCFERHKVQKALPWPWASPVPGVAEKFANDVRTGALLTLLNVALSVPVGWVGYANVQQWGYSGGAEAFPGVGKMAAQLVAFIFIEDALFYVLHRTLHNVRRARLRSAL